MEGEREEGVEIDKRVRQTMHAVFYDCYWKLFTEALVSHEMYENTFTVEGTSSMKDSAFNHCQINLGLGHSVSD